MALWIALLQVKNNQELGEKHEHLMSDILLHIWFNFLSDFLKAYLNEKNFTETYKMASYDHGNQLFVFEVQSS